MTVGQLAKGLGSASIGELVILRQVAESRDGWSAGQGARQRLYRWTCDIKAGSWGLLQGPFGKLAQAVDGLPVGVNGHSAIIITHN